MRTNNSNRINVIDTTFASDWGSKCGKPFAASYQPHGGQSREEDTFDDIEV